MRDPSRIGLRTGHLVVLVTVILCGCGSSDNVDDRDVLPGDGWGDSPQDTLGQYRDSLVDALDPGTETANDTNEPSDLPHDNDGATADTTQDGLALTDAEDVADIPVLPPAIQEIDRTLDPAYLEPNRGFSLKIIAPLLAEIPSGDLRADQMPWVIRSELVLPSGQSIPLGTRERAFAAIHAPPGYEDRYLYMNADSDPVDQRYTYTASLIQPMSTLSWMKSEGIGTISGDYFWIVIYRSGFFRSDTYVVCPVLAGSSGASSGMTVHFDADTLESGSPIGMMVNSYLTDDRKKIADLSGVPTYHESCSCYETGMFGHRLRPCTEADIDQLPAMPRAVEPTDGREGVPTDALLEWFSKGDQDGGDVAYDLYFGTDNPPATRVLSGTDRTSWKPTLQKDRTYFWRVSVTDDEGNAVVGPVWTFNTDSQIPELAAHTYLIVVDKRLQGLIDDELARYVLDITGEGHEVPAVRYWMPGGHQMLKALIRESWERWGINGVFLIGDMPSAWFEQVTDFGEPYGLVHEEFPIELYFQDMDGEWVDSDDNGIYDGHQGIDIELFSARLIGDAGRIRAYLDRLHDYRTGGSFFAQRRFFSFVDDDWNGSRHLGSRDPYTTGQTWELGDIYGSNYVRREWSNDTGKQDYLDFMAGDGGAEFVYQWIHSDPQRIYFDDNFSPNPDNILTLDELVAHGVQGSFYNLFDCSISRYTEPDGNMATEYVHGQKGLAAVGSTKTGGIFNPIVLHGALRDGKGFGEALRLWFNDTWAYRGDYGFDEAFFNGWWLGMMVQGDPLVTLNAPPGPSTIRQDPPRRMYHPRELQHLNSIMYRRALSTMVHGYLESMRERR